MTSRHPSPLRRHEETLPQSPRRLTQELLLSMSSLMSLWARKATQALTWKATISKDRCEWEGSPRNRGRSPAKRLLSNISSKAMSLATIKYVLRRKEARQGEEDYEFDFGDGGVWQRAIMMGDKCQPLDFSGVIYYDESGKQLGHVPLRSPRASPLPGYLARRADGEVHA